MKIRGLTKIVLIVLIIILLCLLKAFIPLLILMGIYFIIRHRKYPRIEQEQPQIPQKNIPEEITDTRDIDMATLSECEAVVRNDRQIRQETDLRQFKGRTDVTKEELAQYMFEQRYWDGIYERRIQMEEITKYCNLTMLDVEWVIEELKHYHPNQSKPEYVLDNKCCYVRDEEEKAVNDYRNEQESAQLKLDMFQEEERYKKHLAIHNEIGLPEDIINDFTQGHKNLMKTYSNTLRKVDYESWLKMKGYSNG